MKNNTDDDVVLERELMELVESQYGGDYKKAIAVLKKHKPSSKPVGRPPADAYKKLQFYYYIEHIYKHDYTYIDSDGNKSNVVNYGFNTKDGKEKRRYGLGKVKDEVEQLITTKNVINEAIKRFANNEPCLIKEFGLSNLAENLKALERKYYKIKKEESKLIEAVKSSNAGCEFIEIPFLSGVSKIRITATESPQQISEAMLIENIHYTVCSVTGAVTILNPENYIECEELKESNRLTTSSSS